MRLAIIFHGARQPPGSRDLGGGHGFFSIDAILNRLFAALSRPRPGSGEIVPKLGPDIIPRHAPAPVVHVAEVPLRPGVALAGSLKVPPRRLGGTLRYATASRVHITEIGLGIDVAPLGGLAIPLQRLGIVLRDAPAFRVHDAKAELRADVTLLGGFTVPPCRFGVVSALVGGLTLLVLGRRVGRCGLPRPPFALGPKLAKRLLGLGVALLGGLAVPRRRLGGVLLPPKTF